MSIHVSPKGSEIFLQCHEALQSHMVKFCVPRVRYPYPIWINKLMDLFSPILKTNYLSDSFAHVRESYLTRAKSISYMGRNWRITDLGWHCVFLYKPPFSRWCPMLSLLYGPHNPSREHYDSVIKFKVRNWITNKVAIKDILISII